MPKQLQEVFMDFNDEGEAIISVKGVKGKACKDLTATLEHALGEVVESKPTEEMRETEVKHSQKLFQK